MHATDRFRLQTVRVGFEQRYHIGRVFGRDLDSFVSSLLQERGYLELDRGRQGWEVRLQIEVVRTAPLRTTARPPAIM